MKRPWDREFMKWKAGVANRVPGFPSPEPGQLRYLPTRYAMPGTDLAYNATRLAVPAPPRAEEQ
eukprot:2884689-Rhodomonas_salina.1